LRTGRLLVPASGSSEVKDRGGQAATAPRSEAWTVAIDVGGTFTDAVALSGGGELVVAKVPSTPADPSVGFTAAVQELEDRGVLPEAVQFLFHGTTIATNAVITGSLARVVLVTTEGYRDVLGYRDGSRPRLYDLEQARPRELVPRRDRLEVRERLAWNGDVIVPLTDPEIECVLETVARRDPESIAVSLLFSYMNDCHERKLGEAFERRFPQIPVTLSSAVAREMREYPRTTTATLNAGLRPIVGTYLKRAEASVRALGMAPPLLIMQSNGGSVPAERADRETHRMMVSGPTAGVAGTVALGAAHGLGKLISVDMGGTSLDVCLIEDGMPPVVPLQMVGVHPILAPSVDVVTVGAGGGSIAEVDATDRLHVGPASAGAEPGPAAYGRGGEDATLTDAHVAVGTLGKETALAGRISLDVEASQVAVRRVAERLGLDAEDAGEGIIAVAMANVVRALRRVSIERGIDPSDFTLVAFGGAGPLHAGRLLREVRVGSVIVPNHPGLFSAAGLMAADLRIDDSQTVLHILRPEVLDEVGAWYRASARRVTQRLLADGIPGDRIRVVGSAACRYLGQGFELQVPLSGWDRPSLGELGEDFHQLHSRTFGHTAPTEAIELVTLRLSGFGGLPRPKRSRIATGNPEPRQSAVTERRKVVLPGSPHRQEVPVLARPGLRAGNVVAGPAIIEEMDSTTVILAGQEAEVDLHGSLWIQEGARR
jgi:N-methylhydantoinase A